MNTSLLEDKDVLSDVLASYRSINLEELNKSALLDRKEVKYVLQDSELPTLLNNLDSEYNVLEIKGEKVFSYYSQYFDTDDLFFYNEHRRGRKNRFKVRTRHYLDSDLSFFEIKKKTNRGRTLKSRIITNSPIDSSELSEEEGSFLSDVTPLMAEMLVPTVKVYYDRITLAGKTEKERITIDQNLKVTDGKSEKTFEGLAIIEVKQERLKTTPVKRELRKLGLRPGSISKYCLGIISTNENIRYNRFKPIYNKLYKPFLATITP